MYDGFHQALEHSSLNVTAVYLRFNDADIKSCMRGRRSNATSSY